MNGPLVLCILDGWGRSRHKKGNAIRNGHTEFIDFLREYYPTCKLHAAGEDVGLPKGFMGNSEVGHINIGAGRVVDQMLRIINKELKNKTFFTNPELLKAFDNAKKNDSTLHLMGLLSDKGVHSHQDHLYALLKMAKGQKFKKVMIHVFTDGRDASPTSGIEYIKKLERKIKKYGLGKIATISGRFYSMDRDKRYGRISKSYDAIVEGVGNTFLVPEQYVKYCYDKKITDEFIIPACANDYEGIKENDSVIFFNYRLDRGRELTHALIDKKFNGFKRKIKKICFVAFGPYYAGIKNVAFKEPILNNTLGAVLARSKLRQFRVAETEKYAHVTFFFNGQNERPYKGESREIIPSPKVQTYDETPQMSANKITQKLIKAIEGEKYDVIIVNYANGDMVGHTGNYDAAIKAVQTVNNCVKSLYKSIEKKRGVLLLTADHGNCEEMIGRFDRVQTNHTTNSVDFTMVGYEGKLRDGRLADIAPTILEILNINKPEEMTGKSLLR